MRMPAEYLRQLKITDRELANIRIDWKTRKPVCPVMIFSKPPKKRIVRLSRTLSLERRAA